MGEAIKALFDVHKLPFKVQLLLAGVSGPMLLSSWVQHKLHIETLVNGSYGWSIGVTFMASMVLVIINALGWVIGGVKQIAKHIAWIFTLDPLVENLDHAEKAVLREFRIHGTHVIELPVDSPAVIGLTQKRFVRPVSSSVFPTMAGAFVAFKLDSRVNPRLTDAVLGIPEGNLTVAQKKALTDSRPAWAAALARQNYLRDR